MFSSVPTFSILKGEWICHYFEDLDMFFHYVFKKNTALPNDCLIMP